MRIESIQAYAVEIPLVPRRRMVSALGHHDSSEFVLVRVTTDAGIEGVGEATVTPQWSGETVWGTEAIINRYFAPALIGFDPFDRAALIKRMDSMAYGNWFAKAAIETACWDIEGREKQQPLYELLGGSCRPTTVRSRFSLGAYPPDVAAERARERVEAGFTTIKVKVGTDPEIDLQRVRAVRAAIGDEIELTVDANGGWSLEQARETLQQLDDCNLALVEQPVARGYRAGLKRLRDELDLPILADESCFDVADADDLLEGECCDAITVYPGKQGGITKARQVAERAAEFGVPCTIGSNLEWDVATAEMVHFVVATPNMQIESIPGDCLGPSYHEFSIVREPLQIEGPCTTLNPGPGLGVEVDWELVERHRLRDSSA